MNMARIMNSKIIMTLSAFVLGTAGVLLTFMPGTTLNHIQIDVSDKALFTLQILGALYLAFAMLNWMTKGSVIGGIYNRPIVMANFTHFSIAGLALIKGLFSDPHSSSIVWTAAILYSTFFILFGMLLFRHPKVGTK